MNDLRELGIRIVHKFQAQIGLRLGKRVADGDPAAPRRTIGLDHVRRRQARNREHRRIEVGECRTARSADSGHARKSAEAGLRGLEPSDLGIGAENRCAAPAQFAHDRVLEIPRGPQDGQVIASRKHAFGPDERVDSRVEPRIDIDLAAFGDQPIVQRVLDAAVTHQQDPHGPSLVACLTSRRVTSFRPRPN